LHSKAHPPNPESLVIANDGRPWGGRHVPYPSICPSPNSLPALERPPMARDSLLSADPHEPVDRAGRGSRRQDEHRPRTLQVRCRQDLWQGVQRQPSLSVPNSRFSSVVTAVPKAVLAKRTRVTA
jgi:hypothetical protein